MLFFEVKGRLEKIEEFRHLYKDLIAFTNRESNIPALMLLQKLEPMVTDVCDSLNRVGLGAMVTHDAPVRGGRKVRINIIRAIFRPEVRQKFSLEDEYPIEVLDKGIAEYRTLFWREKMQLYNPLFWLYQAVAFLARLPMYICHAAGYETSKVEKLPTVRVYLVLVQLSVYYLLAQAAGLFDLFRFDFLAL